VYQYEQVENDKNRCGVYHMGLSAVNQNASKNVLYLRELRNLSRKELAERAALFDVALSETAIRRIEDGSRPLRADEAAAISEIFNIDLQELLYQSLEGQDPLKKSIHALREGVSKLETADAAFSQSAKDLVRARADVMMSLIRYSEFAHIRVDGDELETLPQTVREGATTLPNGMVILADSEASRAIKALDRNLEAYRAAVSLRSAPRDEEG